MNTFFNQHGGFNVKRYKILLLLLFVAILPNAYAVDTVTHYAQPSGYYYGESGVHTWIDWCPLCGCHDCLSWNPKGANPGEWTCLGCGADYDGTNGCDKDGDGARARLERYYEPEPVVPEMEPTQPVPEPTQWELAQHTYQNNALLNF